MAFLHTIAPAGITLAFIVMFACLLLAGRQVVEKIGRVDDRRYLPFKKRLDFLEEGAGKLNPFEQVFAFISWKLTYKFYGGDSLPDILIPVVPSPPPPPPIPEFDIDGALAKLGLELSLEYGRSDFLAELVIFARECLVMDYATPKQTSEEWEATIRRARERDPVISLKACCTYLLNSLPTPPKGMSAQFTCSFLDAISADDLSKAFANLGGAFPKTYAEYAKATGIANYFATKQSTKFDPTHRVYETEGTEWKQVALRSFPSLKQASVPIGIPHKARFEGMWVCSPQGRGKTTLLSSLLKEDLKDVGKISVIIFDGKGDLIEHARQLKEFGPGGALEGKLTLIEPSGDLAINPLNMGKSTGHTIALIEYVLTALLDSAPSDKQLLLLRKLILACQSIPSATIMTIREILNNGWKKYESYILASDPLTAEFFQSGQFEDKETRRALQWRIEDLITRVDLLKGMFNAPETKIDLSELMDDGRVIIIDNSWAKLTDKGSELFGRFFVALILQAAQQRAGRKEQDKKPCVVYLDEAQSIIANDPTVAKIIQTCRSQKIAMVFSHQELQQIKSEDVHSALGNCAIRMANPDNDAAALASVFRCDAQFLQNIQRGCFALFIRDFITQPIIVSVPNDPVWDWPKMSGQELEDIRSAMRDRYCYTPTQPIPPEPPLAYDTSPGERG